MQLVWNLSYVYERCRSASQLAPNQLIQVKGENLILAVLQQQYSFLGSLSIHYNEIALVRDSVRDWIAYLDKKYADQWAFLGPPTNLEPRDAENLAKDCQNWLSSILGIYSHSGTVLINEDNVESILPYSLTANLDAITQDDLKDGVNTVLHLLPTPAAMILFRVAENTVRKYFAHVTGKEPGNISWANLLKELEQTQQMRKSLLGYLQYLRDKRNEAEHPDKRFTQEESERILLHIKGLLEEVQH
jgi:hypothetical protein